MDGASFLSALKQAATMRSAPDDRDGKLLAQKPDLARRPRPRQGPGRL